jgi:hypothetical protein
MKQLVEIAVFLVLVFAAIVIEVFKQKRFLSKIMKECEIPIMEGFYDIDWDGPNRVKVMKIDSDGVYVQRVVKGVVSNDEEDQMYYTLEEFQKEIMNGYSC